MASRPPILPDMPIFGSDGVLVGTVHRVSGVRIVLNRIGVVEADLHYIPLARVADVSDRVTLDCPAADAQPGGAGADDTQRNRLVGPLVMLAIGAVGIALLYGVITLALRDKPEIKRRMVAAAAAAVPPVAIGTAPPPASTPVVAKSVGPQPVSAGAVAQFLASDLPLPQRYTLDSVGFAGASGSLDANGEKAVRALAGVMTTHLNTMIKLSVTPGAGVNAARRAQAIRARLIALGVADYRIATGPSRAKRGEAKSGVEMIILRK
jgi:hypothetical protein